ncbi:MAG: DUF1343 domain-containing protein [Sphingobacteriales bacterium JAD_PAG50586_3]|nr:MAG: DUF1343 domain-containing protein [Sphingobacteriales bacterium JAD_PAG50586_3]
MKKIVTILLISVITSLSTTVTGQALQYYKGPIVRDTMVLNGADNIPDITKLLPGKRAAIVANQTSVVRTQYNTYTHLVDTLVYLGVPIAKIFAPEHGFRGMGDAGEHIKDSIDAKTGKKIVSLYGKNAKPDSAMLADVDYVIFDIQDVGARFYTYISTLTDMMYACAKYNKELLILDRPNPNGFYVDGAVLDTTYRSFVGMHTVPVVHGMTVAEFALMINGERWLKDSLTCKLSYIKVDYWDHKMMYQLPIAPSPNLKTMESVYLYPSLCLFEGTNVSVGRGTKTPFEMYGSPYLKDMPFTFTPKSMAGSKKPMHIDAACYGENLHYNAAKDGAVKYSLSYLINAYNHTSKPDDFFGKSSFFEKLEGSGLLRQQVKDKVSEEDIRKSWQPALDNFKKLRKKYLLYPDFE